MNALDFFIKNAEFIEVLHYSQDEIEINICMERNDYGRTVRAIRISRSGKNKGIIELSCYSDWGDDGEGSAAIRDVELPAIMEFISAFKAGQDTISQICSLMRKDEEDVFRILISANAINITWRLENSCSINRAKELHSENEISEELEKDIQKMARLIWKAAGLCEEK